MLSVDRKQEAAPKYHEDCEKKWQFVNNDAADKKKKDNGMLQKWQVYQNSKV